jgi:DNA polymerase-3 subunit gamma/tau
LTQAEIERQLSAIVEREGFQVDAGAARLLAQRAQGSLRDAEVLLDQVVAAADGPVSREVVERLLGLTGAETYLALSERIAARDARGALALLDQVLSQGAHLSEFLQGWIEHWRDLMLLTVSEDLGGLAGPGDDLAPRARALAGAWSRADLARLVGIALNAGREMRRSDFPRVHLELALVEMAELPTAAELGRLLDRLDALGVPALSPATPRGGPAAPGPAPVAAPGPGASRAPRGSSGAPAGGGGGKSAGGAMALAADPIAARDAQGTGELSMPTAEERAAAQSTLPVEEEAAAEGGVEVASAGAADLRWAETITRVRARRASLASILTDAVAVEMAPGILRARFGSTFHREKLLEPRNRELLNEEVRAVYGRGIRLEIEAGEPRNRPPAGEPAPPRPPTRFSPGVETILERFDGVILDP